MVGTPVHEDSFLRGSASKNRKNTTTARTGKFRLQTPSLRHSLKKPLNNLCWLCLAYSEIKGHTMMSPVVISRSFAHDAKRRAIFTCWPHLGWGGLKKTYSAPLSQLFETISCRRSCAGLVLVLLGPCHVATEISCTGVSQRVPSTHLLVSQCF